jgi:hypothetical protein
MYRGAKSHPPTRTRTVNSAIFVERRDIDDPPIHYGADSILRTIRFFHPRAPRDPAVDSLRRLATMARS